MQKRLTNGIFRFVFFFFILLGTHNYLPVVPVNAMFAFYLCITLLPFLFASNIQDLFSRRAELEFLTDCLNITEYHLKNGDLKNHYSIRWADLISYKYYNAGKVDIVNLKFYFKNGKSKLLKFRGEKKRMENASENEISLRSLIESSIEEYNSRSNEVASTVHKLFRTSARSL